MEVNNPNVRILDLTDTLSENVADSIEDILLETRGEYGIKIIPGLEDHVSIIMRIINQKRNIPVISIGGPNGYFYINDYKIQSDKSNKELNDNYPEKVINQQLLKRSLKSKHKNRKRLN